MWLVLGLNLIGVALSASVLNSGLYNALNAISHAREISPNVVAAGLAESLTTTLFGMVILVLSGLAWFGLRARYRRLGSEEGGPLTRRGTIQPAPGS